MEVFAFVVLFVLSIGSGIVVITHRSAVISALALAFNLVSIAGFFFLLDSQFIGFIQVIVYAGAIMVLILFVIMLLNVQDEAMIRRSGPIQLGLGVLLAIGFVMVLTGTYRSVAGGFDDPPDGFGTVQALGRELFTAFFYPFEAISLLLVVAMIGAVLLAKRRL